MARSTTSLRLSDDLRERLAIRADVERTTFSALIQRYVHEGLAMDEHHSIYFKKGYSGRRAALAGGPDIWSIASALRRFSGSETEQIRGLAEEFGLKEHLIVAALNYYAANREEIDAGAGERSRFRAGRALSRSAPEPLCMRFLVDAMLPPQTIRLPVSGGHDAASPTDLGGADLPDAFLVELAASHRRV